MRNNETLQKDVQDAIKWEPLLTAAEIGVTVKDGVVTLTGTVDSYVKKAEAEDAAKKVAGVKGVVEKIDINFGKKGKKEDSEIATDVINALSWDWQVPNNKITVEVEDGWVTLDGELHWNYQKDAAKKTASKIVGVKWVTNNITIKSESLEDIEKKDIEGALARNWSIGDQDVQVKVSGHTVSLDGTVNSWYQKDEAGKIAWNAPGVWFVNNDLVIDYID